MGWGTEEAHLQVGFTLWCFSYSLLCQWMDLHWYPFINCRTVYLCFLNLLWLKRAKFCLRNGWKYSPVRIVEIWFFTTKMHVRLLPWYHHRRSWCNKPCSINASEWELANSSGWSWECYSKILICNLAQSSRNPISSKLLKNLYSWCSMLSLPHCLCSNKPSTLFISDCTRNQSIFGLQWFRICSSLGLWLG